MRKLFSIKIEKYDDDNTYRFIPDADSVSYGAKELTTKATDEMLLRFLRRCKVADVNIQPRSYRSITYKEIVQMIQSGEGQIYVFSHKYPKDHESLIRSMS